MKNIFKKIIIILVFCIMLIIIIAQTYKLYFSPLAYFTFGPQFRYWPVTNPTNSEIIEYFQTYGSDESPDKVFPVSVTMVYDPLIIAGEKIIPVINESILKKEMPNRKYAIWFLANQKSISSLPNLKKIITDENESNHIRFEAMRALNYIDKVEVKRLLKNYSNIINPKNGTFGNDSIHDDFVLRRTYKEAFWTEKD